MLLVEGALARVQGALGLIPAEAAAFIDRAAREVLIDPAALAAETARNGVPIPGVARSLPQGRAGARADAAICTGGPPARTSWTPALPCACAGCWSCGTRGWCALTAALGQLAEAHADLSDGRAHLWPGRDAHQLRRGGGRLGPPAACATVSGWPR